MRIREKYKDSLLTIQKITEYSKKKKTKKGNFHKKKQFSEEEKREVTRYKEDIKRIGVYKVIMNNASILAEYRNSLAKSYTAEYWKWKKENKRPHGQPKLVKHMTPEEKESYDKFVESKKKYEKRARIIQIKVTYLTATLFYIYKRAIAIGIPCKTLLNEEKERIAAYIRMGLNIYNSSDLFGVYGSKNDKNNIDSLDVFFNKTFNNKPIYNQYNVTEEDKELRRIAINEIYDYVDSQKSRFKLLDKNFPTIDKNLKKVLNYVIGILYLNYNDYISQGLPIPMLQTEIFKKYVVLDVLNKDGNYEPLDYKITSHTFYNFGLLLVYLNSLGFLLLTCSRCDFKYLTDTNKIADNIKDTMMSFDDLLHKSKKRTIVSLGNYETITKRGIEMLLSLLSLDNKNLETKYKKGIYTYTTNDEKKIERINCINKEYNDTIKKYKNNTIKKFYNLESLDKDDLLNSIISEEEHKIAYIFDKLPKSRKASYNFLYKKYMELYDKCSRYIPETCITPLSYGKLRPTSYFDISKKDSDLDMVECKNSKFLDLDIHKEKNKTNSSEKKPFELNRKEFYDTFHLTDEVDRCGSVYNTANTLGNNKFNLITHKGEDIYESIAKNIFHTSIKHCILSSDDPEEIKLDFCKIPTRNEIKRICMSFAFGKKSHFKSLLKGFRVLASTVKGKDIRTLITDKRFIKTIVNLKEFLDNNTKLDDKAIRSYVNSSFPIDASTSDEERKELNDLREASYIIINELLVSLSLSDFIANSTLSRVLSYERVHSFAYLIKNFGIFDIFLKVLHIDYKGLSNCLYYYKQFPREDSYSSDYSLKKLVKKFIDTQKEFRLKLSFPTKAQYSIFLIESIHTLLCINHIQNDAKQYLAQYNYTLRHKHPLVIPHYDSIVFNPNFFNKEYIQYVSDYYSDTLNNYVGQCRSYYYIKKYLIDGKTYKPKCKRRFSYRGEKFVEGAFEYYKNYIKQSTANPVLDECAKKAIKKAEKNNNSSIISSIAM